MSGPRAAAEPHAPEPAGPAGPALVGSGRPYLLLVALFVLTGTRKVSNTASVLIVTPITVAAAVIPLVWRF